MNAPTDLNAFGTAYAEQRAAEGKAFIGEDLLSLPYLARGPLAPQWAVRAATFDAFERRIVRPLGSLLDILDLGAGNGWLSYRLAIAGHRCTAVDIRDDAVDGLGAARPFLARATFATHVGSFDALPFASCAFDITLFNAALHYAVDLAATLAEAARVTAPGGWIAILDTPFYAREDAGKAMVAEKHRLAGQTFGARAETLLGPSFVEFLTAERLANASSALGLRWKRHRVRYPLWYELRPLIASLRGRRPPSRFDFWTAKRS